MNKKCFHHRYALLTGGRFVLLLLSLLLLSSSGGYAHGTDTLVTDSQPTVVSGDTLSVDNKVDILDALEWMIGQHKRFVKHKVTESRTGPFISGFVYPGYAIVTGMAGVATFNISYRTKRNPEGQLSFINNNFQYTQYNQVVFLSLSNFYTNNNKWQFPGDIRYYHFPTTTYGLGTNTLPAAADNIDYSHFRFYRTVLRSVVPHTFLGGGYNLDYRWNIEDYSANEGHTTAFSKYGYSHRSSSSGISADFLYDTRDNANRPLTGTYFNLQIVQNLKLIGSTSNWASLNIDIRKYIPLTHRWYTELTLWGFAWFTLHGRPPYLDLPSVGWDSYNNTGRGYAAGRYRGRNMLYFETELRFDILRNGLLGGVVFGNLQTLSGNPGRYFGDLQPGGGAGLRIKFNKHTSTNSALDYGFGSHGSRGFATNLNEVF